MQNIELETSIVQPQKRLTINTNKIVLKKILDISKNEGRPFLLYRYPDGEVRLASYAPLSGTDIEFAPFEGDPIMIHDVSMITLSKLSDFTPFPYFRLNNTPLNILSKHTTDRTEYVQMVTQVKEAISQGIVDKVVLSKAKIIETSVHPIDAFLSLEEKFERAFVYCFYHPLSGTWVGASPEKLLERDGQNQYHIHSLAGTKRNTEEWSEKEVMEQKIVTDYITDHIRSLGVEKIYKDGPFDLKYGDIKHLKTRISFYSTAGSNEILKAIHPTPAVCGMPKEKAKEYIHQLEGYDRSFYTGYVGVKDKEKGEETYFVNLRCMQWTGDNCYLYTGAGIVAGSVPEDEWNEVEAKAQTLLDCMKSYE